MDIRAPDPEELGLAPTGKPRVGLPPRLPRARLPAGAQQVGLPEPLCEWMGEFSSS